MFELLAPLTAILHDVQMIPSNSDTQDISIDDMMRRIKEKVSGPFDLVVAVERGGMLPGYLAARYLDVAFTSVALRFRDESHQKLFDEPQVVHGVNDDVTGKTVLLVDDVSNSGATLRAAARLLPGSHITTMVISGAADISLFGPHDKCIHWPWQS